MDRLEDLLDSVLDVLADNLSPPLYTFIASALSHALALCSMSLRLFGSLISKSPDEWDLQSALPPIVTILAAYLALASLYRTTAWLFRLVVWFIKWGSIIGILGLGAGWVAAIANMNGGANNGLGDIVSSFINGRSNAPSHPKKTVETSYRASLKFADRQYQWQYDENQQDPTQLSEAQKIMQSITETANQMLDGSSWWQLAKVVAGRQQPTDTGNDRRVVRRTTRSR